MLYSILRPITRIVLRGYYRKIYVNGHSYIPKNQPVILAVNHPSAFTEPCVLATHLERELHFLIRGDVINPKVKWFFDQTNQLPIYRFRDGFSSMRQNEKQFSYCFDLLQKNGCIVIFAEGSTKHVKHTRPIQKGAARIAFGAMDNRSIDEVWVVPVGVNFESSPRPRSIVAVEIGEPVSSRALYADYKEDERRGLKAMTDQIYAGLKPVMVHIEDQERFEVADDLLRYVSEDLETRVYPIAEYGNGSFFNKMKHAAEQINQIPDGEWDTVTALNQNYQQKLIASNVIDRAWGFDRKSLLGWIMVTPLALLGWLFIGPAKYFSFSIQSRLNNKAEYISGFRMAGFLMSVPVLMILWMALFSPWMGFWVLTFIFVLPVLSFVAILWSDYFGRWKAYQKWKGLNTETRQEIIELRQKIMAMMSL